ncbi:hypothetical protein EVAR_20169_1 [Eumeta japonica]|uniref:Uncharacterized protein n=1 Tax=Eumeta variegata TaxID=151549 RepID=A0A4C1UUD8_EUMVA|nr:hypothetical protein EVAR_20169_1 [Eumeta japonica]
MALRNALNLDFLNYDYKRIYADNAICKFDLNRYAVVCNYKPLASEEHTYCLANLDAWRSTITRLMRYHLPRAASLWNDLPSAVFPIDDDKKVVKKSAYFFLIGRQPTNDYNGPWAAVSTYIQSDGSLAQTLQNVNGHWRYRSVQKVQEGHCYRTFVQLHLGLWSVCLLKSTISSVVAVLVPDTPTAELVNSALPAFWEGIGYGKSEREQADERGRSGLPESSATERNATAEAVA